MLTKQSLALTIFAFAPTFVCGAMPGYAALKIAATGKTTIVVPKATIASEDTSADELKHYLAQITGSNPQIVAENSGRPIQGTAIYLGSTEFAKTHLNDKTPFADEEWAMQTSGNALILDGGRPRGTLYAVYHFLEDVCGVHWWTPFEETVPAQRVLSVANLNRREKPAFHYRDMDFTRWRDLNPIYDEDGGRFMARSRLNRQSYSGVSPAYGGSRIYYGPPEMAHTITDPIYIDPDKYYPTHPDWFTRIGDKNEPPTAANLQLAFSNPEMRKEFLRLLLINIRETQASYTAKGWPAPNVYDISQNDNDASFVNGPADEALVKANGGARSAVLLSFINYLADGVKDEFPDVYIDTLAYLVGEQAPTNMTARDNVVIRLTDTSSNVLLPITDERNRATRKNVENWEKICKNLRIWDYNITFRYPELPQPTMHTYPTDLRFLLQHRVEGEFIQIENPVDADMRDMKIWVLCKLLENPNQSYSALVKEFTDGYYGAAGPYVRQYLTTLENAAAKSGAFIQWTAGLDVFLYLNTNFLQRADSIYAKAAAAVKSDPLLSRRVAVVRAPVDIAILRRFPWLMKEWRRAGNADSKFPLDRATAGKRYLQAMNAQIDLWVTKPRQQAERETVQKTVDALTAAKVPAEAPMPTIRIGQAKTAPVIDGKLDDVAWKQGIAIGNFSVTGSKTPAREATQARLTYDAQNLYISWRAEESLLAAGQQHNSGVRISAQKLDDDVLSDDSVELFLQPGENAKVAEFDVNSIGTLFDAQSTKNNLWGTRNAAWNSGAKVAAVQEDGYWTAELAIPWKALGLNSAPAKGASFAFALARNAASRGEVSAWTQNDSTSIHEITNFGRLVFGDSAP